MGDMMNNHTPRRRTPGKRNPAGSKIARRICKTTGTDWKGEVFHDGELTKANNERAQKRAKVAAFHARVREQQELRRAA